MAEQEIGRLQRRDRSIRAGHVLVWVVVLALSLATGNDELVSPGTAATMGLLLFVSGLGLFGWAVVHLGQACWGMVEPVTEQVLVVGPYRFVRHPMYLGAIISLLGFAVAFRSLWGVAATLVVFVPASIWRARLEERAMARCFGSRWEDYARRTCFLMPPFC